jgi:hypothetical protein
VLDFAAGTLIAADVATFTTTQPRPSTTNMGTALAALGASVVQWEVAQICTPITASMFDEVEAAMSDLFDAGKYRSWIGNTELPGSGDTEAEYLADMSTAFAAKASVHGMLCAGATWLHSAITGRQYTRPISFAVGARQQTVSQEINIAAVNLGALPGVSIRDSAGNVVHHDESINPGLDDARFTTLRTWDGIAGVYVNRPRIFSAGGSDFDIMPKRLVINLAHAALRLFFIRRLNEPLLVDADTGFILEQEARDIEANANAILRTVLLAKPKASAAVFTLSRTDNVLSTQTLTGSARIVPLAYPETIELEVGFSNPALQTQAV